MKVLRRTFLKESLVEIDGIYFMAPDYHALKIDYRP